LREMKDLSLLNSLKTKYRYAIIPLIVSLAFSGCIQLSFDNGQTEEESQIIVIDDNESDTIVVEKVQELSDNEEASVAELPEKDLVEAKDELVSDGRRFFIYEQLTEKEKTIYAEIYSILQKFAKDTTVSTLDPEMIDKAFNAVMLDHPEIFYVSGYSFTKYTRGSNLEKITVTGTYTMTEPEIEAARSRIDTYVNKCISGYNGPQDDYEIVKYVYEYLIKNTEYDLSAPNNQNILSIVDSNRTVCQGYAKMTQYILQKMGVFSVLCEGTVKGTEPHVWNIVEIDDKYYHVDTTWGDASYQVKEESDNFEVPDINYDFLCISDDSIKETHVFKDDYKLPECNSMDANYYVKEGLYLETVDTSIIAKAFVNARENGESMVTLKCANANVYAALYSHLIENHKIFDYISGDTTVNYVEFRDRCRISFYI